MYREPPPTKKDRNCYSLTIYNFLLSRLLTVCGLSQSLVNHSPSLSDPGQDTSNKIFVQLPSKGNDSLITVSVVMVIDKVERERYERESGDMRKWGEEIERVSVCEGKSYGVTHRGASISTHCKIGISNSCPLYSLSEGCLTQSTQTPCRHLSLSSQISL